MIVPLRTYIILRNTPIERKMDPSRTQQTRKDAEKQNPKRSSLKFPRSVFKLPFPMYEELDTSKMSDAEIGSIAADTVGNFSRLEITTCFASVFFPNFIEHDGMVFLEDRFTEKKYKEVCEEFKQDLDKVQRAINYTTMNQLLSYKKYHKLLGDESRSKILEECLHYVALKLGYGLKSMLRESYPTRSFKMIVEQTGNDNPKVWAVTFYEKILRRSGGLSFDIITLDAEFHRLSREILFSGVDRVPQDVMVAFENFKDAVERCATL